MSYYNHPFFGLRASSPSHFFSPTPAHRRPQPKPHAPFAHYPSPAHYYTHATPDYNDLEAEERVVLAHLRSIQQRLEAEQAAIRLRAQEERETAIRRAIAQQQREQAIAAAIEKHHGQAIERQRQQAIIQAIEREQHAAAIQSAIARQQQVRQRIIEEQRFARAQFHAQHEARQQVKRQQIEQALQKRMECFERCANRYAQNATKSATREVKKEYKDKFEALSGLLGGLFGFHLGDGQKQEKNEEAKETEETKPATTTNAPAVAAPAPATQTLAETPAFPEDVNDLLTDFLGLRIEPTTADAPKQICTEQSNKLPNGLNEFLSRYGLEFEPLDISREAQPKASTTTTSKTAAPAPTASANDAHSAPVYVADPPEPSLPASTASSSSSAKVPAPTTADDHPLTSFLNSFTDMPPFVRDILGNVELAFKEELNRGTEPKKDVEKAAQGKGKGVTEGEKQEQLETKLAPVPVPVPVPVQVKDTPASIPVPTSTETETESAHPIDSTPSALSTLSDLSTDLNNLREGFTFPSTLAFVPSATADQPTPALLFNKTNSAYHAQAHKLLQLLLAADNVSSGGNKDVRRKRKGIVRAVEQEIEGLEKRRDEVWEVVKDQRARGEEQEFEQENSSCASSSVDPAERRDEYEVEHHEHVEDVQEAKEVKDVERSDVEREQTEKVPGSVKVSEGTPDKKENYAEAAKEKETAKAKEHKEEEGYELL